jgi:hypothetical protein
MAALQFSGQEFGGKPLGPNHFDLHPGHLTEDRHAIRK